MSATDKRAPADDRDGGLLAWQWRGYAAGHRDRLNLWLHLLLVPVFIGGTLGALTNALHGRWLGMLAAFLIALTSLALQGLGHRREFRSPQPFRGAGDFIKRTLAEQFITFPRFVIGGHWLRAVTGYQPARH